MIIQIFLRVREEQSEDSLGWIYLNHKLKTQPQFNSMALVMARLFFPLFNLIYDKNPMSTYIIYIWTFAAEAFLSSLSPQKPQIVVLKWPLFYNVYAYAQLHCCQQKYLKSWLVI